MKPNIAVPSFFSDWVTLTLGGINSSISAPFFTTLYWKSASPLIGWFFSSLNTTTIFLSLPTAACGVANPSTHEKDTSGTLGKYPSLAISSTRGSKSKDVLITSFSFSWSGSRRYIFIILFTWTFKPFLTLSSSSGVWLSIASTTCIFAKAILSLKPCSSLSWSDNALSLPCAISSHRKRNTLLRSSTACFKSLLILSIRFAASFSCTCTCSLICFVLPIASSSIPIASLIPSTSPLNTSFSLSDIWCK